MSPQKRQTTPYNKKMPEKTPAPAYSMANTSQAGSLKRRELNNPRRIVPIAIGMNRLSEDEEDEPQAAPPPNKRMALEAPVPLAQVKPPEPANKLPMNALMQQFAKTAENYDQLKKEIERIQRHGTCNFVVTNEFVEKMKEVTEKTSALNALVPDCVKIQPIRKRIQLIVKNCRELFTENYFSVRSPSIELIGFKWSLEATTKEKGFLGLYLLADPPNGFKGNYRIEMDCRFSILNAFSADKDLIKGRVGRDYTGTMEANKCIGGWGFQKMAKFEDLLDANKTFLTPEGDIEAWVDFTIKSSTLNHLP